MAFYVSLQATTGKNSGRRLLIAGPYSTHGQALAMVTPAQRAIEQLRFDPIDSPWFNYGTCRTRVGRPPAHPAVMAALGDVPLPAGLP